MSTEQEEFPRTRSRADIWTNRLLCRLQNMRELSRAPLPRKGRDVAESILSTDFGHMTGPLYTAFNQGQLTRHDLLCLVPYVWRYRTGPDLTDGLTQEQWIRLFGALGYTECELPTQRPRRPRRLYRGAAPSREHGMSWTTSIHIAAHFARDRQPPGERGGLYTAIVEPGALLAYLPDELEYVLDPAGITELQAAAMPPPARPQIHHGFAPLRLRREPA